jgi:hypothetical protein
MASEKSKKKHLILALLIFNTAFWPYIYSQRKNRLSKEATAPITSISGYILESHV